MKIAVIILNWNGQQDTLACLQSLRKITYPNFFTIVVDNASSDDTCEIIRQEFPEVSIVENEKNLGFAEGNNRGIRLAISQGADAIFLLNNDTIVDPHILDAFVKNGADVQGAAIYLFNDPTRFDHLGGIWNAKKFTFDLIASRETKIPDQHPDYDYFCGAALFIKREVLLKIGLLEPRYFLYWEESDFCCRAKKAGYSLRICMDAKVWHKVGASSPGKPHTTYFWWRNRILFVHRNCTPKQVRQFWRQQILPAIWRALKLYLLKTVQLRLTLLFNPQKNVSEKRRKIHCYRATLKGVLDYCLKRTGNGPAKIS